MENKLNRDLSYTKKLKSKSLKELDKIKNNKNPLNHSINLKMLNQLGILLSPSSFVSRNSEKNNLLNNNPLNNQEKVKKIKLLKNIINENLPNISTKRKESENKLYINSSTKTFSNKLLLNNFSSNKTTINSIKLTSNEKKKNSKITTTYIINKSTNMSENNNQNDNNVNNKLYKELKINKNDYTLSENNFYKPQKLKKIYSSQKNIINSKNNYINSNRTLIDGFLNYKHGIFNLSDFNRKLLCKNIKNIKPIYKKDDKKDYRKDIINKIKEHNLFTQIQNENKLMKQKIKKNYESFKEFKNKYYLKKPNENTYEGFSKIYYDYNKDRGKKQNIYTNRLISLNWAGDNGLQNIDYKEKLEKMNKSKLNNILLNSKGEQIYNFDEKNKNRKLSNLEVSNLSSRANRKVEKLFPDMLGFNLPKIFHDNKTYTIKLLYDVFIEFKTLLKFCILFNNDINIHNKGIDFETFFNCNTKINQQGKGLSKKIFKTLNNKVDKKYLPWGNYIDGMMRMKDPDMNNKMDLFFEILDENGDGSLDYNEVYNLSLVSLQRTISQNPLDILKKSEKEKNNQKEVIEILAEFFSNMIFSLVNIDIKDDIPIDILRKKMQEGGEAAEYLEMFLCADNFA